MSWNTFRRNVLATMRTNPSGPDQIARAIASSYDMVMRSPGSGDLINKHYLVKGNTRILEIWINSVFLQQSFSPISLPPGMPILIAQGFPQYWIGATLSPGLPAAVAPPGIVASMNVLNPGVITPIPFLPSPSDTDFVENIITLAKMHLFTIGGQMIVNVPSPTGFIPTPAPWFGYKVQEELVTRI